MDRIWQITEGLVASDGHITRKCFLTVTTTNKEFARQVEECYRGEGFKTYFGSTKGVSFGKSHTMYRTEVYNRKFFASFRGRWYDDRGRKVLPRDFTLAPLVLNALYCGDGYLRIGPVGYPDSIWLYTMSFGEDEVSVIVNQLSNIGISSSVYVHEGKFVVRVSAKYVNDFLRYCGEPVFKCFRYKWKFRPLDANTQEEPRISGDLNVLTQAVELGTLKMYRRVTSSQNPTYEMVLWVPAQYQDVLGETVKGRRLKKLLERCLDRLSDVKKRQAIGMLAMPIGRRRQDVKYKVYQRFLEISGSPEETERGDNSAQCRVDATVQ